MKVKEVIAALEQFAPLPLQEGFDNAGLQLGLTEAWEVSGALLCLDVTENVLDEAIRKDCNLIVSHHPLIFHKLSCISGVDFVQRIVMRAIEHHVAIVSMHTNMDNARGGVNFKIAEKLGLAEVDFFAQKPDADAGSGVIGTLPAPMEASEFIAMLKERFAVECVQANELLRRPIKRVAVCGGAGSFLLSEAEKAGADAFVTGEMHYHDFFDHEQKIQICVIGHYQSEQFTNELFREIIERQCPGVRCEMTETNTNPIQYF
ncbi:MAG: Nif3-like dinuclear metal center hexameric protein [Prevotella sp.]|nr:Nif3-like dinuclear metal center hexameric protein [Prevotella sp.]